MKLIDLYEKIGVLCNDTSDANDTNDTWCPISFSES